MACDTFSQTPLLDEMQLNVHLRKAKSIKLNYSLLKLKVNPFFKKIIL